MEEETCKGLNLKKGQLVRIIAPSLIYEMGIVGKVLGDKETKQFLKQHPPFNMWNDDYLDNFVLLEVPDEILKNSNNPLLKLLRKQTMIYSEREVCSYLVKDRKILQITIKERVAPIKKEERDFWYKAYQRLKRGKFVQSDYDYSFGYVSFTP